ncbi:MAG: phosphoglycerate kinase [Candidatus Methanomethylicia archaeon]
MSLKIPKVLTMDSFNFNNKYVLVRIDINSPIDPESKIILDDARFREHAKTIRELIEGEARITLTSHQGRPGDPDFTSLNGHAELLSSILGVEVKFIDDVCGPAAREAIRKLNPSEVLLLENVRFHSEELLERKPELQAKTYLVSKLTPLFNYFILDAFATAHRSQPSIVGFPLTLKSCAGRIMEAEIEALRKIYGEKEGRVFILGGSKIRDSLKIMENLLVNKVADKILLTGLLALVFLYAKDVRLNSQVVEVIKEKGLMGEIPKARELLRKYSEYIKMPIDGAIEVDGRRVEGDIESLKGRIMDIGAETINLYREEIKNANTIIIRGPAGVIEKDEFRIGSEKIVKAAIESGAYIIFGGGHMRAIVDNITVSFHGHMSTGGGALLTFLSGEPLPGLEALAISAQKYLNSL